MPYFGPKDFSKVIWSLKCLNYLVYFIICNFFLQRYKTFLVALPVPAHLESVLAQPESPKQKNVFCLRLT